MTYPQPNARYNPWRSYEQAAANAEPGPTSTPPRGLWPDRYAAVVGAVVLTLTVFALVLAVASPWLIARMRAAIPVGMAKVYDAAFANDGTWGLTSGCSITSSGLHVVGNSGDASCAYGPSDTSDLTSQGFWLQVTVAPAGQVAGSQVPEIAIGSDVQVSFDQQGEYTICTSTRSSCLSGATSAWHSDDYVPNTIGLQYSAATGMAAVFVNSEHVADVSATIGVQDGISLGAAQGGEALYTHVTFYSASAS
jgi:hypothetical protein